MKNGSICFKYYQNMIDTALKKNENSCSSTIQEQAAVTVPLYELTNILSHLPGNRTHSVVSHILMTVHCLWTEVLTIVCCMFPPRT